MSGGGRALTGPRTVLVVSGTLLIGGVENLILETAIELRRRGNYYPVVCNLSGTEHLHAKFRANGIPVHSLHHRKDPRSVLSTLVALRALARESGASILHTHQFVASAYGRLCSLGMGIPTVYHTHNTTYRMSLGRRLADRVLTRANTSAVIVVTSGMAESLTRLNPDVEGRLRLMYNAVNEHRFRASSDGRGNGLRASLGIDETADFIVGAVGRFDSDKRYDRLIAGFAELLNVVPSAWLVLVGDGPLAMELRALTTQLSVSMRVTFTGWRDDMPRLMSMFDVLVISSETEAFPLVALEALSSSCPVVMTEAVSALEVLRGVTVVAPGDGHGLASAMSDLYFDQGRREELGRTGRGLVEKEFGLSAYAERIEALYDSLLADSR